jgi:hypothetical protein
VATAEREERQFVIVYTKQHLALALSACPESVHQHEARALALELLQTQGSSLVLQGLMHLVLARVEAGSGKPAEGEVLARKACELLAPVPVFIPLTSLFLGSLLLNQGRMAEAREVAARALRQVESTGGGGWAQVGLLQVLAEACFAGGDTAAGEQALRQALECVRARANIIEEEAVRERFLHQVPENARILELERLRELRV